MELRWLEILLPPAHCRKRKQFKRIPVTTRQGAHTHTHTHTPPQRHILLSAEPGRLGQTNEIDEVPGKFGMLSEEAVVDKWHHRVIEGRRCAEVDKGKGWRRVDIHVERRVPEAVVS